MLKLKSRKPLSTAPKKDSWTCSTHARVPFQSWSTLTSKYLGWEMLLLKPFSMCKAPYVRPTAGSRYSGLMPTARP